MHKHMLVFVSSPTFGPISLLESEVLQFAPACAMEEKRRITRERIVARKEEFYKIIKVKEEKQTNSIQLPLNTIKVKEEEKTQG